MKSLLLLLAIFVVFFLLRRMSFSYRQKLLIRQKNLLDCQLKLDKIAYKMEEKLLKEEFRLGTPCHDIWFPIVNRTRYADKYFSISSLLRYLVPTYRQRVLKEIEEMNNDYNDILVSQSPQTIPGLQFGGSKGQGDSNGNNNSSSNKMH